MLADEIELRRLPLGDSDVEVALLDVTRIPDLDATAARFLTVAERQDYKGLRLPARRREWLGARVCLKTMLLRHGRVNEPTECAIVKDARGRPELIFASGAPAGSGYDCSLSHKGRFACASASTRPRAIVGVDIEEVSPRLLRLAEAFARDRDSLICARSAPERLALLWGLKEACAKATGGGIGMAMKGVTCEETAPGRHRVWTDEGLEFEAWDCVHDGHVVVLCVGNGS